MAGGTSNWQPEAPFSVYIHLACSLFVPFSAPRSSGHEGPSRSHVTAPVSSAGPH